MQKNLSKIMLIISQCNESCEMSFHTVSNHQKDALNASCTSRELRRNEKQKMT